MANLNSVLSQLPTIFNTDTNLNVTQLKARNIATGTPTATFVPIAQADGTVAWGAVSGGGGGMFTSTARWTTTNAASKNAYTSPGVVNSDGITLNLIASSGAGQISNASISLNGVALTGTYNSSGVFPNYVLLVPVSDLSGNAAEVSPVVNISIVGTFSGSNFNVSNAGTLTNVQPIPFTTTLTGSYAVASVPFYQTTAQLNYSYTNSAAITGFNGVFTPGGNAGSATGSLANVAVTGSTISGSATGNGQFGAGPSTITLTGTVAALPVYTPAFYSGASTGNTPPTFTTSSSQTPGAEVGSTITYTTATAATQFVWLATTRPITSIRQVTSFGPAVVTANVTATQVISGTTFNVFGFSNLATTTPVMLSIIS